MSPKFDVSSFRFEYASVTSWVGTSEATSGTSNFAFYFYTTLLGVSPQIGMRTFSGETPNCNRVWTILFQEATILMTDVEMVRRTILYF